MIDKNVHLSSIQLASQAFRRAPSLDHNQKESSPNLPSRQTNYTSAQDFGVRVTLSSNTLQYGLNSQNEIPVNGRLTYETDTQLYHSIKTSAPSKTLVNNERRLSPTEAANNILTFIERKLKSEASDSDVNKQDLSSLIQQGRDGVEKGYSQARNELDQMGLMTEQLAKEIDESYQLIQEGFARIEATYLKQDGVAEYIPSTELPKETVIADAKNVTPNLTGETNTKKARIDQGLFSPTNRYQSSTINSDTIYRSELKGALVVTTKDGDKVYLNERFIESFRQKLSVHSSGYDLGNKYRAQYDQEMYVIGELDSDEMKAIESLIIQSSEIATLLHHNNFTSAIDSALNIEFDTDELLSFSLDISSKKYARQESTVYEKPDRHGSLSSMVERLDQELSKITNLLDTFDVSNQNLSDYVGELLVRFENNSLESSKLISLKQSMMLNMLDVLRPRA